MYIKEKLKIVFLRILLPLLVSFVVSLGLFIAGVRTGARYQLGQDQPFMQACLDEVLDVKRRSQGIVANSCSLTDDQICAKLCPAIAAAVDGAVSSSSAYKDPSSDSCVCFFIPEL